MDKQTNKKEQTSNSTDRRNFIKSLGLLSAGGSLLGPANAFANELNDAENVTDSNTNDKPVTINILQTTDVHCQIHPHDELFWENNQAVFRKTGGYEHLSTYVKQQRKKNPNTFLIDTGDMFQGSELSVKTTGNAIVPILNALSYDLYLPGNWEVIYGKKRMQTLMSALTAPKVCANMYHDLGNGKRGELIFHPYKIWNVAGVKIGFLGYTDPLVPIRQSPNYSKGILYTQPEENLAHYVDVLKNDEGCAYIIILSHLGLSQQLALANNPACQGVDMIFGGDTHERVREPIVCKYSKVVEPGAFGSFIGRLSLTIQNGKVISETYALDELDPKAFKADKEITALINVNEQPFAEDINKVVGYSTIPLYRYFVIENPIDTMVLDALKWRLPDIDIVLSNGFRFCPPRTTPDQTGKIPITKGFIFDMLPVDSTVRTALVSGQQIYDWLEKELNNVFAKDASKRFGGWVIKFKGMTVKFKAMGEMGKRVEDVKVAGQPLDLQKMYSIAACERDGDPDDMLCRIKGVSNPQNTPYTLHSTMLEYLATNSPVTPTPPRNAVATDVPETLLSQVFGVDYEFR
jgi:2',3'-cyclic-nucleotide 2'-phosphodiesterase (5'-nucleotidase family)